MKTTSLRFFAALLILSVPWVIVPGVQADDDTDYVTEINHYVDQIYQEQKESADYINSVTEQATNVRDDLLNQGADVQPAGAVAVPQPQAPAAGPLAAPQVFPAQMVPQDPVAFTEMVRQNQERVQQQILQGQRQILQQTGWAATPPAVPQQLLMLQDPVAFQQMVRQNQEMVRQQIMQTRQQMMQMQPQGLQQ